MVLYLSIIDAEETYLKIADAESTYALKTWTTGQISTALTAYYTKAEIIDGYYDKNYITMSFYTQDEILGKLNYYYTKSEIGANYYTKAEADEKFVNGDNYYTKDDMDRKLNAYLTTEVAANTYASRDWTAAEISTRLIDYLTINEAKVQYMTRSQTVEAIGQALALYYNKAQTDAAIAAAIANLPVGGGGGGSEVFNPSYWVKIPPSGSPVQYFYNLKFVNEWFFGISGNYWFCFRASTAGQTDFYNLGDVWASNWEWKFTATAPGFGTRYAYWRSDDLGRYIFIFNTDSPTSPQWGMDGYAGLSQIDANGWGIRWVYRSATGCECLFLWRNWVCVKKAEWVNLAVRDEVVSFLAFAKYGDLVAVAQKTPRGKLGIWFWLISSTQSVTDASAATMCETPWDVIDDYSTVKIKFINESYVAAYSTDAELLFIVKYNGQSAPATLPNGSTSCEIPFFNDKIYPLSDKIMIILYYAHAIYLTNSLLNPTSYYMGPELSPSSEHFIKAKFKYGKVLIMQPQRLLYSADGIAWKSIQNPNPLVEWTTFSIGDGKIWTQNNNGGSFYYSDILGNGSIESNIYALPVQNMTITHNAPLGHGVTLENFEVGDPVYMTGNVYKFDELHRIYITTTDAVNCIASVKPTGEVRSYLGICCKKCPASGLIEQDTLEFATHGDAWVRVSDSSDYQIGDTLLLDKSILGEDQVITNIIRRMIIGTITAKINKEYVAVMLGT
jgi:hypothetical protein